MPRLAVLLARPHLQQRGAVLRGRVALVRLPAVPGVKSASSIMRLSRATFAITLAAATEAHVRSAFTLRVTCSGSISVGEEAERSGRVNQS